MTPTRRTMIWLSVWLVVGLGVGVATLAVGGTGAPAWVEALALTVAGVSLAGPILLLGWMLGRVFARAGGPVGVVFTAGVVTAAAGQGFGIAAAEWWGWGAAALGAATLALIACRHRISRAARRRRVRRAARRKARTVARLRLDAARIQARAAQRRAADSVPLTRR